jgi:heme/copper-type cytochrome/quinol oxidase subunit 4
MSALRFPRPGIVWLILVAITVVSFEVAENGLASRYSAPLLFGLAAIKAWLVMLHYMETPHAARQWRWLYPIWAGGIAVFLMIGHVFQ